MQQLRCLGSSKKEYKRLPIDHKKKAEQKMLRFFYGISITELSRFTNLMSCYCEEPDV